MRSSLTIVIPTRNRPDLCASLARFLRRQGVTDRIVIADSSDLHQKGAMREACGTISDVLAFSPDVDPVDKLTAAVGDAETPFIALLPDDDIPFPHAIARCHDYLASHPDVTAAQGYVLDFAMREELFDIQRVLWFVPSIIHKDPLWRMYQLIRRYQPFFWAVFRRDALLTALREAPSTGLVCMQEMMFMLTLVLLGKFARLPCVYMLRGVEETLTPQTQSHPLFALLDNSDRFFADYWKYRENIIALIERHVGPSSCPPENLRHLVNLIHAIYWGGELRAGPLEDMVQHLFDPSLAPPKMSAAASPDWRVHIGDLAIDSPRPYRRYVWRREVLEAKPRGEITISEEERARVTSALDDYEKRVTRS